MRYVGLSVTASEVLYEILCNCGGFGGAPHVHIVRGPTPFTLGDPRRRPVFSMRAFRQRFGPSHNCFPNTILPSSSELDGQVEAAWKGSHGPSRASDAGRCDYARVRFLTSWRPPSIIRCVAAA